MITRNVKRILPPLYDISSAPWYDSIKREYDRFSYRVILISYLVNVNIPLFLLIREMYKGETALLLNYAAASAIMLLMLLYLVISKNIRVMRVVIIMTLLAGLFSSVLLKGGCGTYIIIVFNFIPVSFSIFGRMESLKWFLAFILSCLVLAGISFFAKHLIMTEHLPFEYIVTGIIAVTVMFLIVYTIQHQQEKVITMLVRSIAYDKVTGLPNKDSLLRCIHVFDNSILAIIHISNFKSLATLFGYDFTDRVLVIVTGILQRLSSDRDFRIYKLNWQEFGIQIPCDGKIEPHSAELILTEILNEIIQRKLYVKSVNVNLTVSTGAVIISGGDYGSALAKADAALGYGLSHHKNVTLHKDCMNIESESFDRMQKYSTLYDNIMNGTLKSYMQPVVLSHTGDVSWYESLLRIKMDNGSYHSVAGFLSIAIDTDLYPLLTSYVLGEAGRFIRETGHSVSVNLSFIDIMNSSVLSMIEEIAADDNYTKGMLIIEIIESEEISDPDECIRFIRKVQSIGVRVAIDDFGAGYSSISNLLNFGIDIVKFDGELIRRLNHDSESYSFIKGIYSLCSDSGYSVVAEHVDNENVHAMVKEIGIEYCQGYLFGRPEPPAGIAVSGEAYPDTVEEAVEEHV